MSQVIQYLNPVISSLNAVVADTVGDVLAFKNPKIKYYLQYMATIPSGQANLFFEASLDGANFFIISNVVLSADGFTTLNGGPPALFVRARVTGLANGRTVSASIVIAE